MGVSKVTSQNLNEKGLILHHWNLKKSVKQKQIEPTLSF